MFSLGKRVQIKNRPETKGTVSQVSFDGNDVYIDYDDTGLIPPSEWRSIHDLEIISVPDKTGLCWHDWKKYTGFTEQYEYCSKCDEKRPLITATHNTNTASKYDDKFYLAVQNSDIFNAKIIPK